MSVICMIPVVLSSPAGTIYRNEGRLDDAMRERLMCGRDANTSVDIKGG